MALWDADNDGVFGGGSSVFGEAPTFWGDITGATAAADAIMDSLGTADTTTTRPSDSFFIPYSHNTGGATSDDILTTGIDDINGRYDTDQSDTTTDIQSSGYLTEIYTGWTQVGPMTSFQVSAVPVPAAVWLFGSGLLGLIGVARRKARA